MKSGQNTFEITPLFNEQKETAIMVNWEGVSQTLTEGETAVVWGAPREGGRKKEGEVGTDGKDVM